MWPHRAKCKSTNWKELNERQNTHPCMYICVSSSHTWLIHHIVLAPHDSQHTRHYPDRSTHWCTLSYIHSGVCDDVMCDDVMCDDVMCDDVMCDDAMSCCVWWCHVMCDEIMCVWRHVICDDLFDVDWFFFFFFWNIFSFFLAVELIHWIWKIGWKT